MKIELNNEEEVPVLVSIKKLSKMTGISEGVIRGWCDRGYLKTTKIGKHLLIDVLELQQRCKQ